MLLGGAGAGPGDPLAMLKSKKTDAWASENIGRNYTPEPDSSSAFVFKKLHDVSNFPNG